MDTLIVLLDRINNNMVKNNCLCQSYVQNTEMNCDSIAIVVTICVTILIIAVVAMIIYYRLKKECVATKHHNNGIKNERMTPEYIERLLSFLEKYTLTEEYNKDLDKKIKSMKPIESDECQYYIKVLTNLIREGIIPQYPQNNNPKEGE